MKRYIKSRLATLAIAGLLSVPAQAMTVPEDGWCTRFGGCVPIPDIFKPKPRPCPAIWPAPPYCGLL